MQSTKNDFSVSSYVGGKENFSVQPLGLQSYQKHGFKEQLNPSVTSTAPGSSTVYNPMSYAPTTSEDQAG